MPVQLKASDAGKSVALSIGQQLVVQLPTQLGTGFSWDVDPGVPSIIKLESATTEQGAKSPGGSEIQTFSFSGVQAGSGKLSFSYRRPWEKDKPAAQTFAVTIEVGGP
jgi:inhibitor of cysteine peptidase